MGVASDPPVISGLDAVKAMVQFFANPVGTGRSYHARLGANVILKPPFSKREGGRKFFFTANEQLADKALKATDAFRSVGVALTRGPKDSAQRRLRNGIVRMNGPQQQALRRAYTPPLAKNSVAAYEDKMRELCRAEIASWPRDREFDATEHIRHLAKQTAANHLFGAEQDSRAMEIAQLLEHHSEMQYSLSTYLFPVNLKGTPYHRLLKHAEKTETALIDWMADQPACPSNLVGCIAHMEELKGEPVTARARAAQLWTLYGASFDTTASTLRWAILHLAWNGAVQARLIEEISEHGAASDYLDAVVTETLRMTPPVAYQMRRLNAASDVLGIPMNRGDHVVLSAAAINRDPEVYEQPNAFRPERWLSMRTSPMRPLAFSAGPRRCLGSIFATMVLRLSLLELCRSAVFRVPDASKVDVRLSISQAPKVLPLVLKPPGSAVRSARFKGNAAEQMSRSASA